MSAVIKPGGKLVSQEVAESIVRFVAGGSELQNAEVEPSLLSLICRELNTVRQAQGKAEISADLLAGSRDTILSEFYERALADQPAGVRRVIEDELLTESGYRESLAEERVAKALAAAGAEPDALAKLVDRRLLRIEERLDMRRVELTHDVLCSVVRSSRNLRHEREARDEAERQLAAQQERAAETRRTLHKTRRFAMIAAGLMLVALVSAVFGWINWNRAKAADQQAQKARADAEKLVGFLIEDFYAELEPTGRLETMGKLAHMAVSYYDGLPQELLTPQTQAYRGMALIREAGALLARGDFKTANPKLDEAWRIFDGLRAQGDRDRGRGRRAWRWPSSRASRPGASPVRRAPKPADLQETADLLRPWIKKPGTSAQTRMLYADVLNYLSHTLPEGQDVAACEEARAILLDAGARNLTDLRAASIYADTTRFAGAPPAADGQGRRDRTARDRGLLDTPRRCWPSVRATCGRWRIARWPPDLLGRLAIRRHDYAVATDYAAKSAEAGENYVRFNPSDLNSWVYWVRGLDQQAQRAAGTGPDRRGDRRLPEAGGAGAGSAQACEPGAAALEQLGPVDDQRGTRRSVRGGPRNRNRWRRRPPGRRRPWKSRAVRDKPCSTCTGDALQAATRPGPGQQPGRIRPGDAVGGATARARVCARSRAAATSAMPMRSAPISCATRSRPGPWRPCAPAAMARPKPLRASARHCRRIRSRNWTRRTRSRARR